MIDFMSNYLTKFAAALLISAVLAGCESKEATKSADILLLGGRMYTADPEGKEAEAIAINGEQIVFVGSSEEAEQWRGVNTEVVDLRGQLVLPGLHDTHIHPFFIMEYDRCDLKNKPLLLKEISATVKDCITRFDIPEGELLNVDLWNFAEGNEPDTDFPTIRAALDAASTKHGIYLAGSDGHHGGANSFVLDGMKDKSGNIIGYSAETIKTTFSHFNKLIGVDSNGEPDGYLTEDARPFSLVGEDSYLKSKEVKENIGQVPEILNRIGITSIQEAAGRDPTYGLFDELYDSGRLSLRVVVNQFYDPDLEIYKKDGAFIPELVLQQARKRRAQYKDHPLIKADGIKIFADGVIEGNPYSMPPALPNAAMKQDYKQPIFDFNSETHTLKIKGYVDLNGDACESARRAKLDTDAFMKANGYHPDQCIKSNGVLESPEDIIRDYAKAMHKDGFTLHIHAIGDRAVHVAVDAIAKARKAHGSKGLPHQLGHIQIVDPEDIKVIGEQGIYLSYTYAWITAIPAYDLTVMPFIDEIKDAEDLYRDDYYSFRMAYPTKQSMDAGATLIAGSDAPVDTRDPRPFTNIMQAVTRASADGSKIYNSSERIDIREVINAYTINGAKAMRQADITGSLEVGKKADIIILGQDIIQLADDGEGAKIGGTQVLRTYFNGKLVYQKK